jgi:hypothetical protein
MCKPLEYPPVSVSPTPSYTYHLYRRIPTYLYVHLYSMATVVYPVCDSCKKDAYNIKVCGECKTARYCSKECQTAHWKVHKPRCVGSYDLHKLIRKESNALTSKPLFSTLVGCLRRYNRELAALKEGQDGHGRHVGAMVRVESSDSLPDEMRCKGEYLFKVSFGDLNAEDLLEDGQGRWEFLLIPSRGETVTHLKVEHADEPDEALYRRYREDGVLDGRRPVMLIGSGELVPIEDVLGGGELAGGGGTQRGTYVDTMGGVHAGRHEGCCVGQKELPPVELDATKPPVSSEADDESVPVEDVDPTQTTAVTKQDLEEWARREAVRRHDVLPEEEPFWRFAQLHYERLSRLMQEGSVPATHFFTAMLGRGDELTVRTERTRVLREVMPILLSADVELSDERRKVHADVQAMDVRTFKRTVSGVPNTAFA